MNYNISFGKMLELDLVIESKDMCCLLPGVLHWCFGTISVVWSLAQGGSKLGIAADWPRGRSCAPSRAGVGRQCTDKGTWVFLYAQILPTHLAFVTNVCLKAVSDVSVPFLSLSLDSILISPCQCSIQNTCRHSLGSATVSFVQFYFFFFL